MTQLSIPNTENGDLANDELLNSRFAEVVSVVNGNLDGDNLQDNSIPYSKLNLADASIPSSKMTFAVNTGTNAGTAGGSANYFKLGELLVCWGTTDLKSGSSAGTNYTITFPSTFAATPTMTTSPRANVSHTGIVIFQRTDPSTTSAQIAVVAPSTSGGTKIEWIAIGKAAE